MLSGPITCYGRKARQFIIFMKLFKFCLKKKENKQTKTNNKPKKKPKKIRPHFHHGSARVVTDCGTW